MFVYAALVVINSRNALLGAGDDGLRFSSIVPNAFGRDKFGASVKTFWRRIFYYAAALSTEVLPALLAVQFICLFRRNVSLSA